MNSEIIFKYFSDLNNQQKEQFIQLQNLYTDWNQKINVISRKDIDNLYTHHILHSLAIAKFIQFQDKTTVVDIGTGGGFPGIPLSILFPQTKFILVDSIKKKLTVVDNIAKSLQLSNIQTSWNRIENLNHTPHFYVSRAVAEVSTILNWINTKISSDNFNSIPNGLILLKGGDLKNELSTLKKKQKEKTINIHLNQYFKEDFFETKKLVYIPVF